jgi:hypothetical protein
MTLPQSTIPEEDSASIIVALKDRLSLQPQLLHRALDPQKAPPLPKISRMVWYDCVGT